MKQKKIYGEILRFGIVGVGATALHYGIYYLLQQVMNVNVAYTVGYVLSFVANFYATAYFTFANYLLHIVLLNLFLYVGIPKVWAPLPVFAIAIPVNFILVRFVFKHKR